ncbi:hypothetical protein [Rhizobium leguminosarum]|uniref:hypothetical protein n=1 Tax=Rhizobium leguminosarum TaxID=384 RepID=UPI002F93E056
MIDQTERLRKWEATLRTMAAQRREEATALQERIGCLNDEAIGLEADAQAIADAATKAEKGTLPERLKAAGERLASRGWSNVWSRRGAPPSGAFVRSESKINAPPFADIGADTAPEEFIAFLPGC